MRPTVLIGLVVLATALWHAVDRKTAANVARLCLLLLVLVAVAAVILERLLDGAQ